MTDAGNNALHLSGVEGTVKWFSNRKGFGFITAANDALTEEIFVHQTGIVTDGQFRTLEVSFVLFVVETTIWSDFVGIFTQVVDNSGGFSFSHDESVKERSREIGDVRGDPNELRGVHC